MRSPSGRSKVRRYQTTGWNPVSPIPLAGDSGGYGTTISRSKGPDGPEASSSYQRSSRPVSASS